MAAKPPDPFFEALVEQARNPPPLDDEDRAALREIVGGPLIGERLQRRLEENALQRVWAESSMLVNPSEPTPGAGSWPGILRAYPYQGQAACCCVDSCIRDAAWRIGEAVPEDAESFGRGYLLVCDRHCPR
jgi:hypothetical protein